VNPLGHLDGEWSPRHALSGQAGVVRITSDRTYQFDVGPDELWAAISSVEGYRSWWPWLRRFDAAGLVPGDDWSCTVQPPLPYALRFTVSLEEVVDHERIEARVSGDIEGTARLEISARDGGSACEARLTSALAPRNGVLKLIAATARPVVRFGHDWVLDTGARQFRTRAL
jgi:uncharacterized protein YndB with AHSA1/START domain